MSKNIKILFWIRKSRRNVNNECPIMGRITLHSERKDFDTELSVDQLQWNSDKHRIRGKSAQVTAKNETLETIEAKLRRIFNRLTEGNEVVTIYDIYNVFTGKDYKNQTLLQLIQTHNENFKRRLETDRSYSTYEKYTITATRLEEFLQADKGVNDVSLRSLNVKFIQDFEQYLLRSTGVQHNTAVKYVKNLKRLVNYAVEQQWLDKNPFMGFKRGYRITEQVILTQEELDRIYNKQFSISRLKVAKNLFLLQCYTGLSYVDMKSLMHNQLQKGAQGKWWLNLLRTKTEVSVSLPLFDRAYEIICQLQPEHDPTSSDNLLPVICIQRMNSYLKEIADTCEINKNLTTHVGRRTMASTVLLANGVPIETISKILGHTNIRTTQVYARVKDVMIYKEMERVEDML
jgi:site-specific recombinase XerD